MLNSFEISSNVNDAYTFNYELNENIYFNYDINDVFTSVSTENGKILLYGYCFDVRKPEVKIDNTLSRLLENSENFNEEIKFLNGHFIMMYKLNDSWKLITDAVGMTTVYFDASNKVVATEDSDEMSPLNGFVTLDLSNYTLKRLDLNTNKLTDERIERVILDSVINQYKYFEDKLFTLNFRRNKMNKAIISLLYPSLYNQALNLRENDANSIKIAEWLSRDYKMELLDEGTEPSTRYLANTHLMDYESYKKTDIDISGDLYNHFISNLKLGSDDLDRTNIEYNLLNKLRYRKEQKNHLMFDPFNVIAIQERIYNYNDKKIFKPLDRIIKIMHPSIDFYDFAKGETLLQKYKKVKKENKKLKKEMKQFKVNDEFLRNAEKNDIKVSDNLDGKILADGVTVYPASQTISKDDRFEIQYKKKGNGMILIESYFDNPKNAHRIKVSLNDEEFNIDEFLKGKFINTESDVNLTIRYERDYDAPSWQKAGKITIREV